VLPAVEEIVSRFPDRTVFTRFVPPARPQDMPGSWQRYYQRWSDLTLSRLDPSLIELVPSLARFVPPAAVIEPPSLRCPLSLSYRSMRRRGTRPLRTLVHDSAIQSA